MNETKETMLAIVKKILQLITGRPIPLEGNFLSNLNSMEFVTLVVELENVLEIEFEESKLVADAFPTSETLVNYLLERKAYA